MRARLASGFDEAVTPASEVSPRQRAGGQDLADRRSLLAGIERCYDALPRAAARVERHGPLVLFVRAGDGWPYYARPRLGAAGPVGAAHVTAVRERQRELGEPETLEWVHETTPSLFAAASQAGLTVRAHPLLAVDVAAVRPTRRPAGTTVRPVTDLDDLAQVLATQRLAFAEPGAAVGAAGRVARDEAAATLDPRWVEVSRSRLRSGMIEMAAAYDRGGPVAVGGFQRQGGFAEISGVGTLPASRRRGLGAALTAALVAQAAEAGADVVFLSASDAEVARVYERIGFRLVGAAMVAAPPARSAGATAATAVATAAPPTRRRRGQRTRSDRVVR